MASVTENPNIMKIILSHPLRDMERKRGMFIRIGLVCSLLVTFVAFEWETAVPREEILKPDPWEWVDTEFIPVTHSKNEPSQPTPETSRQLTPSPATFVISDQPTPSDTATVSTLPVDIIPIGDTAETEPDPEPWLIVEIMPKFPGGEQALMQFLSEKIRYPDNARKAGLEGAVHLGFVVDEKGDITEITCLRSPGEILTAEAMRVVGLMPRWKPGIQSGHRVKVRMTLPVNFRLIR